MSEFELELAPVLLSLGRLMLGILVLILGKFAKDWLSPYNTQRELTDQDNPAFGLTVTGYYAAIVIIYISVVRGVLPAADLTSAGVVSSYGADLGWAIGGIAALAFSRWLMDRSLTGSMHCSEAIVKSRNVAAGAVECGVYLACGLVVASVLRQPGGNIFTVLGYFLLSQLTLLLFARLYQKFAGYDMIAEIRSGNVAAGVALCFTLVALALLIVKGTSGEYIYWSVNLSYYTFDVVVGFILLLVLRWLTDLALLPNARIAEEIARDRNVNAGLVEGVIATGVASLILFVF